MRWLQRARKPGWLRASMQAQPGRKRGNLTPCRPRPLLRRRTRVRHSRSGRQRLREADMKTGLHLVALCALLAAAACGPSQTEAPAEPTPEEMGQDDPNVPMEPPPAPNP